MEDDDFELDVDNIINQIKNQNTTLKRVEKEYPDIDKKDVEAFIRKHASRIIIDTTDTLHDLLADVKSNILVGKEIDSVSTLINAFNSTVNILQKQEIADNKNKTQKEVTQMTIDAKQSSDDNEKKQGALMSREELLKLLHPKDEEIPKEENNGGVVDV